MTCPMGVLQWSQTVSTSLPHLRQPPRTGLVLWSCGIVLAQSCGLTTVATFLAYLLGKGEATVREQLRDWYRDGQHNSGAKRGDKRGSQEVVTCVAPALRGRRVVRPDLPPPRFGNGCLDLGTACYFAAHQRCRPWMCHPGGLAGGGGHPSWGLAPALGSALWACAGQCAPRLDGHCPGRSGPLRPLGLPHHADVGLASLPAH